MYEKRGGRHYNSWEMTEKLKPGEYISDNEFLAAITKELREHGRHYIEVNRLLIELESWQEHVHERMLKIDGGVYEMHRTVKRIATYVGFLAAVVLGLLVYFLSPFNA